MDIDNWANHPTRGKLIEGVFRCELKLFILALAASIERAILIFRFQVEQKLTGKKGTDVVALSPLGLKTY